VTIPPGGKAVVDVVAYSDGAAGPWALQVEDFSVLAGGTALLSVSVDKAMVSSGDVAHVTVTRADPSFTNGTWGFVLVSRVGSRTRYAFGLVNI
jgi:hypothetical protein